MISIYCRNSEELNSRSELLFSVLKRFMEKFLTRASPILYVWGEVNIDGAEGEYPG
jgi:hypothetical protein